MLTQLTKEVGLKSKFVFSAGVQWFFGSMWFLPILSTSGTIKSTSSGVFILKFVDQGWIEGLGGQGAIKAFSLVGTSPDHSLVSGIKIYLFSFFILVGAIIYYF